MSMVSSVKILNQPLFRATFWISTFMIIGEVSGIYYEDDNLDVVLSSRVFADKLPVPYSKVNSF